MTTLPTLEDQELLPNCLDRLSDLRNRHTQLFHWLHCNGRLKKSVSDGRAFPTLSYPLLYWKSRNG